MRKPKSDTPKVSAAVFPGDVTGLVAELRQLIEQSRGVAMAAAHASLTLMYWRIGRRIRSEMLARRRASYGGEIVVTLSRQLIPSHFLALPPLKDPWPVTHYVVSPHMLEHERSQSRRTHRTVAPEASP